MSVKSLVAVVLAAGSGVRLRPLTLHQPKPLLTVNNEVLLTRALTHAFAVSDRVAVNCSYHANQMIAFLSGENVHIADESSAMLGTAGAIVSLRDWIGEADCLVLNADTWHELPIEYLVDSWDGMAPRLLAEELVKKGDFGKRRFVGASLLPNQYVQRMSATPGGLFEAVWKPNWELLQFCSLRGRAFDCGTASEFLEANLFANCGRAVVHPTARAGGPVIESVLLAGAVTPEGHAIYREVWDRYCARVRVEVTSRSQEG